MAPPPPSSPLRELALVPAPHAPVLQAVRVENIDHTLQICMLVLYSRFTSSHIVAPQRGSTLLFTSISGSKSSKHKHVDWKNPRCRYEPELEPEHPEKAEKEKGKQVTEKEKGNQVTEKEKGNQVNGKPMKNGREGLSFSFTAKKVRNIYIYQSK